MKVIPPATIEAIHRTDPSIDLLWHPIRGCHVIVQKLRGPVPIDSRLRDALPEGRNGAKTCNYQYLGYCELTYLNDDGTVRERVAFIPEAHQILTAVRTCTRRVDDSTGWRDLEEHNRRLDEKAEQEWREFQQDVEREATIRERWGARYSVPGSTMVKDIRS